MAPILIEPLANSVKIALVLKTRRRNTPRQLTTDEFRAWIIQRRRRETVADIADTLGVTPQAVWYWSTGKRTPLRQVLVFAAVLAHGPQDIE